MEKPDNEDIIIQIDWLLFNVQQAIFQLYSGREHLKIQTPWDSKQGKMMGRDGQFCQCNRSLMDHSSWAVTLGSLTCGEGGNLSTRDLGFIYVSSAGRIGCEFLHPTQPTDAPSSRRSSRSHFYTPRFPRGWPPFRGLVPLGRRNLVPILPPAHPPWGGFIQIEETLHLFLWPNNITTFSPFPVMFYLPCTFICWWCCNLLTSNQDLWLVRHKMYRDPCCTE
jgi:hypothetical protein